MQLNKTKLSATAAVAGAFLRAAPHIARADGASDRAAITARYSTCAQALKARDFATEFGMQTPDFTQKMVDGTIMARDKADAYCVRGLRRLRSIASVRVKCEKITIENGQASVLAWASMEATMFDAKGRKHSIVSDLTERDTWIKTAKGWFIRQSVELTAHFLVDGHPRTITAQRR